MNKIIRIALANKFPGIEIEALMEVINQTPNAIIAIETLMDVYEAPDIPWTSLIPQSNKLCTFVSFDKYAEKVTYTYDSYSHKTLYFFTQIAADACLEYDEAIGREYYSRGNWDVKKEFKIPNIATNSCELKLWLKK
jgi:hypothetical protein